jgi:hypothetical protein
MNVIKKNLSNKRGLVLYLIAFLVTSHVFLFYGFPDVAKIVAGLLLAILFLFIGGAQALLLAISLAVFTLLLNAGIHFAGLERSLYYRPHELLKSNDPDFGDVYKPNTQFSMYAPFNDIQAMENVGIIEPHEIFYHTDEIGFRNPSNYHGQQLVLVGDSFIAGVTDTQSCILTEWLRREHQLDTYNLGHPGGMDDYVNRIKAFRQRYGDNFRVLLFVFESNDFDSPYTGKALSKPSMTKRYSSVFRTTSLWRYSRSLYLRGVKSKSSKVAVKVKTIGGQPVAFYKQDLAAIGNYTPLVENRIHFVAALNEIKPVVSQIFFIPAKYRVYSQWISKEPLPNEQWNYLTTAAKQAGIPAYDLTPALTKDAARLLPQGEYVYWRADTHWNCNGMRAAATEVARVLSEQ